MDRPIETPTTNPCHLLRVPLEIRHCIYDHIRCLDTLSSTIWRYRDGHGSGGFFTAIIEPPVSSLLIPWFDIMLTCQAIHAEISDYMNTRSVVLGQARSTWVLELALRKRGQVQSVNWRQISCHPTKVEVLVAELNFPTPRVSFFGDGGPRAIVRQLYQTLNWVLHYGPVLSRMSPLPQPLKLKTLVLRVCVDHSAQEGNAASGGGISGPVHGAPFYEICFFVRMLTATGILGGYIDTIRILDEGGQFGEDITLKPVQNPEVPERWDRYGFEWGTEGPRRFELAPNEENS